VTTTIPEILRLRAEVVRTSEAIEANVFAFQDAVDTLIKAEGARTRPPWLSYRTLCADISSMVGALDLITYALEKLRERQEADTSAA
jgi:hypothetical protein